MDGASGVPMESAERAGRVLWIGLWTLIALHVTSRAFGSMWSWGFNLDRFLSPAWAWIPWSIAAAAMIPAVGRRWTRVMASGGEGSAWRGPLAPLIGAVMGALLVWVLPDQVRFVGDFLIRQGTVEMAVQPAQVWPQAMPLDAWTHYRVPLWLATHHWTDANGAARLLGAIEAAALAALAVAFARTLELRREVAIVTACIAFFGGTLALFTGYGKAFVELVVLTATIGVAGVSVIRRGRGSWPMGVAFAIALLFHRSALGFLPALVFAWLASPRPAAGSRVARWAAIALPVATVAGVLPRILDIVRRFDRVHFVAGTAAGRTGWWAWMVEGTRPLDAVNLFVLLSPLALVALLMGVAFGRGLPRAREAAFLATLAAPFVAGIALIHPVGGMVRDYDDFATAGAALSLLAAWIVGMTLNHSRRHAWLAAATALAVVVPSIQWLAHNHDLERGLARVEALARESPRRAAAERGRIFDFLGARWNQLERYEDSANAYRDACLVAPSPRMLQQWAMSETLRGNFRAAIEAYHRQLAKEPGSISGWMGLAAVASRIPDYPESRRALHELLKLEPGDAEVLSLLDFLDRNEAQWRAEHFRTGAAP